MKYLIFAAFAFISIQSIAQGEFHQRSGLDPALAPFYHGVASGDPLHDRVILWTRVTPDGSVLPGEDVAVSWRVATDTAMTNIVASGSTVTNDSRDYTVKVDAQGLSPYTCYYFDFAALGKYSLRGRTKTAPQGDADSVRLAVVSCSNYENGYFNSYASIVARNDLDAVLHLGDYLYEYAASAGVDGRLTEPANEIITLSDYRTRYSHYRLDPDLRRVHQQYPFVTVWDDHESANNAWKDGAENHTPGTEGDWVVRKANSIQAYLEWLPVRENPTFPERIYRSISFGDLFKLYMLDTRIIGRDEQVGATSGLLNDPNRSLLGQDQYNWLLNEMQWNTSRWNIIGQQVMMAPLEAFGLVINTDQWDGYQFERTKLYNDILASSIKNVVVLTGDIHTSWANDLPHTGYNASTGAGSVGVEFVVTSVTSTSSPISFGTSIIQSFNSHMKWIELSRKGYLTLDINKDRVQSDWWFVDNITTSTTDISLGNSFFVNNNERFLRQASQPAQRDYPNCVLAPALPIAGFVSNNDVETIVFVGVYPNPFEQDITVQYNVTNDEQVLLQVFDAAGRMVKQAPFQAFAGLNYFRIDGNALVSGTYTLVLNTANGSLSRMVMRL